MSRVKFGRFHEVGKVKVNQNLISPFKLKTITLNFDLTSFKKEIWSENRFIFQNIMGKKETHFPFIRKKTRILFKDAIH